MLNQRQQKPTINNGFVVSPSGLAIPNTYQVAAAREAIVSFAQGGLPANGLNEGEQLIRDENTMAVKFPLKGSGRDDRVSEAIVDGKVANVGVSPVIAPQISAAVRRQGNQAMNSTIDITGKKTPFNKARTAISMFNANPLGVTAALELMVYRLCVYNRGAPVATVPITFNFEQWEEYGMIPHPILSDGQTLETTDRFWLEVDWARFGTPIPFLPDPFDLEATGDPVYPYWYNARREREGDSVWVLLHATQIVPVTPGVSGNSLIGTSPVWMCLGYLAEQILITDERAEKMMYTLADAIYLLGGASGVDIQKDILDKLAANRVMTYQQGFKAAKGAAIIASPVDKVSFAEIKLRQPPGIEFKEWREYCEDVIAFCFGETLSALVVRGGVGYGAQADAATENTMDSAIGAHLARIANALGAIYPRVRVSVTRANDRAARLNIRTFAQFAGAAAQMLQAGVLEVEEVRLMIDQNIMAIPEAEDLTAEANASDDDGEPAESDGSNGDGGGEDTPPSGESEQVEQAARPRPDSFTNKPETAQEAHAFLNPPEAVNPVLRAMYDSDYAVPEGVPAWEVEWYHANLNAIHAARQRWGEPQYSARPGWNPETRTVEAAPNDVLGEGEGVLITEGEADRAYETARRRVGEDCYELLTAKPVEG